MAAVLYYTKTAKICTLIVTPTGQSSRFTYFRPHRVNKTTSSSGMYTGLQTLADTDGEKLWKKLYNR